MTRETTSSNNPHRESYKFNEKQKQVCQILSPLSLNLHLRFVVAVSPIGWLEQPVGLLYSDLECHYNFLSYCVSTPETIRTDIRSSVLIL
jgi:hypothetical protein